ncbi:hypothetical protein AS149_14860 [Burkholderia cenocepacia]|nr:hypothetical protein AS149_14860 [Burkholderia cenocepacia]
MGLVARRELRYVRLDMHVQFAGLMGEYMNCVVQDFAIVGHSCERVKLGIVFTLDGCALYVQLEIGRKLLCGLFHENADAANFAHG